MSLPWYILLTNLPQPPAVFSRIFSEAFGLRQVVAGGFGAVVMNGVQRGSVLQRSRRSVPAPWCSSGSRMFGPGARWVGAVSGRLIDTIVICSCTAFVMLLAPESVTAGRQGMDLLQAAMEYHRAALAASLLRRWHCSAFYLFLAFVYAGSSVYLVRRPLVVPDGI